MCTTLSGRNITPTNYGVPSALDIAVALGKECRWAGHTRVEWWSVLHHTFAMYELAREADGGRASRPLCQLVLVHDAHEAIVRDVPSTWKTQAQKEQEFKLDTRIFQAYFGVSVFTSEAQAECKRLDLLMVRAEGYEIAPPEALAYAGLEQDPDPVGTEQARTIVRRTLQKYPDYRDSMRVDSPLVRWFVTELRGLSSKERWDAYGAGDR